MYLPLVSSADDNHDMSIVLWTCCPFPDDILQLLGGDDNTDDEVDLGEEWQDEMLDLYDDDECLE